VQAANAGHCPPLLCAPGAQPALWRIAPGPPLGAAEGTTYSRATRRLGAGELLLLYTDGVTEARSPAGEMFGSTRLIAAAAAATGGAASVVRAVEAAIQGFAAGAPQADDVALLALRYMAPQPRAATSDVTGGLRRGLA